LSNLILRNRIRLLREVVTIKIVLDDLREVDCKKYGYNRVWTYSDCIILLNVFKNDLKFISLDYHLGKESTKSGYDVLVYMKKHNIQPDHINIHSDHEFGVVKMYEFAKRNFTNISITRNKIDRY
jgi:hypothetical protein